MGAGQCADPHIDRPGADAQRDAAVLRQASLGDVELGHDLQARNQGCVQGPVGLHHLAQAAVDPKPHHRVPLVGLDVNVAGAVPCGLGQQGIEHADDGRIVRGFQQVLDGWQVLHHARQVGVAFDLADHRCGARFALGIGGADALHQGWRGLGLNLAHRVFAHHLAHATAQRRRVQPQRELARLLLEQHLLGAGKSVGQRVAHGRGRQTAGSGFAGRRLGLGARTRRQCGQLYRLIDRQHLAGRWLRVFQA